MTLSVLDLAPIASGSTASEALRHTTDLAQLADRLGYARYWFAEHHGMPSIASSAPTVLIAHVAAHTARIRVGSGGVMMQNHVPLVLAEHFHTLEALHPGRIDLGIGRAPGTDPATSRALRAFGPDEFPQQLGELVGLSEGSLPAGHPFHRVRVVPGDVALPPMWLLGSSGASAAFAGSNGLGYAFASHFSPTPAAPAFEAYRRHFRPSPQFEQPHAVLAVAVVCAPTDEEADRLAKTMDLAWVRIRRGEFSAFPSPEEAEAYAFSPEEQAAVRVYRQLGAVGSPETVRARIEAMAEESGADEVMVTSNIHDHGARLRSFELLAGAFALAPARAA